MGKMPTMLLGVLLMAVLLLVFAVEGSTVTVYNPARILVNVLVDDKNVKVESDVLALDLTQEEQKINFTNGHGEQVVSVDVKSGDVLVVIPEPLVGGANIPAVKLVELPGESDDSSSDP